MLLLASVLARDLQAFLVFSQHPARVYYAGKPTENAVYCLIVLTYKPRLKATVNKGTFLFRLNYSKSYSILWVKFLFSFLKKSSLFPFHLFRTFFVFCSLLKSKETVVPDLNCSVYPIKNSMFLLSVRKRISYSCFNRSGNLNMELVVPIV